MIIGSDFNFKIIDFDTAYVEGDPSLLGYGTPNYRAPEVKEGKCSNPFSADIYSLAIILFTLMYGHYPYTERGQINGVNLEKLL